MITLLTNLVFLPSITLMDKFIRYVYDSGCDAEFYFRQPCRFADYNNHRFWHFPVSHTPGPSIRDADHRSHTYQWSHATSPAGLVGALTTMKMMKSEDDIDYPTYGFFCQATSETTDEALMDVVLKAWYHTSKQTSDVVVTGIAVADGQHLAVKSGGIWAEQQGAYTHGVAHGRHTKHWCIRTDIASIGGFWIVQAK
jgi:hypothetical protein